MPAALVRDGPAAAHHALEQLVAAFGRDRCWWSCGTTATRWTARERCRWRSSQRRAGVEVIATNNVHYATPDRHRLATALAAIRSVAASTSSTAGCRPRRSPTCAVRPSSSAASPGIRVRSSGPSTSRPRARSTCKVAVPNLPDYPVPDGHTDMSWLRRAHPARRGGLLPATHAHYEQAMRQIDYELGVIEQLGFPGYFLLLHDIVEFCRTHDIYCQGRGSAANSAVCFYALGVTKADAVALGLLFERFLSTERDGPPDIDLDIEHQRREEVIQYVYRSTDGTAPRRWRTSSPTGRGRRSGRWRRSRGSRRATPTRSPRWIDRWRSTARARSTTSARAGTRRPSPSSC